MTRDEQRPEPPEVAAARREEREACARACEEYMHNGAPGLDTDERKAHYYSAKWCAALCRHPEYRVADRSAKPVRRCQYCENPMRAVGYWGSGPVQLCKAHLEMYGGDFDRVDMSGFHPDDAKPLPSEGEGGK